MAVNKFKTALQFFLVQTCKSGFDLLLLGSITRMIVLFHEKKLEHLRETFPRKQSLVLSVLCIV